MNDLMKKFLGVNWKTTLAGFATFLTSVPGFMSAATAWAHHQPVDWRELTLSAALTAMAAGLGAAKDSTTHSTASQVDDATTKAAK